MALTINPFEPVYQVIFDKLVAGLPDTSFLLKAPIIIPYSDCKATQFTVSSNVGDEISVYVNNTFVQTFIATNARTLIQLQLNQGRNFVRVATSTEQNTILLAAVEYMTVNAGWAEQYFNEVYSRIESIQNQLASRFSLKQVEHQLVWQDLLPGTRLMRILAGKMAVKSLVNMVGTDEGVLDVAKAVTGNTPVFLPTQLDPELYEPECRLMFSSAHDFAGYEFNIWLFNVCATSWQAFITLMNNLDDSIVKLRSVTDRKVVLENSVGQVETHNFDFSTSECSIVEILTSFLDCFSKIRVFVSLQLESNYEFCAYKYPLDLAVDMPIGRSRLDQDTPFDADPEIALDSCDESDPFCDGLLGLPISCRLDSGQPTSAPYGLPLPPIPLGPMGPGSQFDSMVGLVNPGGNCDYSLCAFPEPCTSMASTQLAYVPIQVSGSAAGNSGSSNAGSPSILAGLSIMPGMPSIWTISDSNPAILYQLHPLTMAIVKQITLASGAAGAQDLVYAGGFIWVINLGNTLVKVNPASGAIVSVTALTANAHRITYDGTRFMYITHQNASGTITSFDAFDPVPNILTTAAPSSGPANQGIVATPQPSGPSSRGAVYWMQNQYLIRANSFPTPITVTNTDIQNPGGFSFSAAIEKSPGSLWAGMNGGGTNIVRRVDIASLAILSTINTVTVDANPQSIQSIKYNALRSEVFYVRAIPGRIEKINPATNTSSFVANIAAAAARSGIATFDQHLWAVEDNTGRAHHIDLLTNTVTANPVINALGLRAIALGP